jgi:dynein heavy chain
MALDKMTIETHVTNMWDPSEVNEYAEDGCYIHGLFLEGARWGEEGTLADSKLKELLHRMPVIHVKSVPIQPEWEASPVGYLRHDHHVYECPIYLTRMRGPTYVTMGTLPSGGKNEKWTLLGCALLMQSD